MKVIRVFFLGTFLMLLAVTPAGAQTFPKPDYFHQMMVPPVVPTQVPGPQGLRDYVSEGKLRLTLADAIRLMLLNNTEIRIDQSPVEQAKFAILSAYQPFDPVATSTFNVSRGTSPTFSQLSSGAPTLGSLNQQSQSTYSQTFQSGTNYQIAFGANRLSSNSIFSTFNPSIFSNLNFSVTQPLLRNRGLFPNRAPIVIARRDLEQSRDNFEAQANDLIQRAVSQYWNVVLARESLKVVRSSLAAAEATYKHDKRALELGALSPLEIYRSESQVAQRRVQVIQDEYALKQTEDQFRQVIGADLDPYIRALDPDLVENPEPQGELFNIDAKTALEQALKHRPELEALRQALANDDTNIRLARNSLEPDLRLSSSYSASGLGGNQIATPPAPRAVIAQGGFSDALGQLFGFSFPTYGFQLTLNLPIRNRAAQASLGKASVTKRNDLYLLRRQQQAITLEVFNAVHQLEQSKLSLEAAKIARDLAQKTLDAELRKYALGVGQIFLVLEAQTELSQAETSVVQAEVGYQLARTAVDHATGNLLERHHVQIAESLHY